MRSSQSHPQLSRVTSLTSAAFPNSRCACCCAVAGSAPCSRLSAAAMARWAAISSSRSDFWLSARKSFVNRTTVLLSTADNLALGTVACGAGLCCGAGLGFGDRAGIEHAADGFDQGCPFAAIAGELPAARGGELVELWGLVLT